MKEKSIYQKGFISIIFIIIGAVIVASATFGVVKYKNEIAASVVSIFERPRVEVPDIESTGEDELLKESELFEESAIEEELKEEQEAVEENPPEEKTEELPPQPGSQSQEEKPVLIGELLLLTSEDLPGWYQRKPYYHCDEINEEFIIDRLPSGEYITDRVEQCQTEFTTEKHAFTWEPDIKIAKFILNQVSVFSNSEKARLVFKKTYNNSLQVANDPRSFVTVDTLAIGEEAFWHKSRDRSEKQSIELHFRIDKVVVRLFYYGNPLTGKSLPDETLINAAKRVEAKVLRFTGD